MAVKVVIEKGTGAGEVFRLHDGINTLGRDVVNRIRLLDPRVSRNHCRIRKLGNSLSIVDLGTRNGTMVNGRSATEAELAVGDLIKVGNTSLRIVDEEYQPERPFRQPGPFSFFRQLSMAFFGRPRSPKTDVSDDEFIWFARRSRSSMWRPPVDTDPPEGRQKTEVSYSDMD